VDDFGAIMKPKASVSKGMHGGQNASERRGNGMPHFVLCCLKTVITVGFVLYMDRMDNGIHILIAAHNTPQTVT
jgi:hypothetical protein